MQPVSTQRTTITPTNPLDSEEISVLQRQVLKPRGPSRVHLMSPSTASVSLWDPLQAVQQVVARSGEINNEVRTQNFMPLSGRVQTSAVRGAPGENRRKFYDGLAKTPTEPSTLLSSNATLAGVVNTLKAMHMPLHTLGTAAEIGRDLSLGSNRAQTLVGEGIQFTLKTIRAVHLPLHAAAGGVSDVVSDAGQALCSLPGAHRVCRQVSEGFSAALQAVAESDAMHAYQAFKQETARTVEERWAIPSRLTEHAIGDVASDAIGFAPVAGTRLIGSAIRVSRASSCLRVQERPPSLPAYYASEINRPVSRFERDLLFNPVFFLPGPTPYFPALQAAAIRTQRNIASISTSQSVQPGGITLFRKGTPSNTRSIGESRVDVLSPKDLPVSMPSSAPPLVKTSPIDPSHSRVVTGQRRRLEPQDIGIPFAEFFAYGRGAGQPLYVGNTMGSGKTSYLKKKDDVLIAHFYQFVYERADRKTMVVAFEELKKLARENQAKTLRLVISQLRESTLITAEAMKLFKKYQGPAKPYGDRYSPRLSDCEYFDIPIRQLRQVKPIAALKPAHSSTSVILESKQIPLEWLGSENTSSILKKGSYCMVKDLAGIYMSVHLDGLYAKGGRDVVKNLYDHLVRAATAAGANRFYLLTEFRNLRLHDVFVKKYGLKFIEQRGGDALYEISLPLQ